MEDFVQNNLIYNVICGSHSYGLNTADSDVDKKGICIPTSEYFFGLKTFEQQELNADEVIYSLNKFVKLAYDCNPNIIEILFTDPKFILHMDKYGKRLRDNRHLFLSKRARYTFGGYAFAQLKRIKGHYKWIMFKEEEPKPEDYFCKRSRKDSKGNNITYDYFRKNEYDLALKKWSQYLNWKKNRNPDRAKLEQEYGYDTKHGMHLIRLLKMGKEIMETGQVNVLRPDREELLAIRNGKITYKELVTLAEKYQKDLDTLYEKSALPNKPNHKAINNLLIEITQEFLNESLKKG